MFGVTRCPYGHAMDADHCKECNRLAQRASRSRRRATVERGKLAVKREGSIWSLLRARGYLNRARPRKPNSLGMWYRGP